MQAQHDFIDLRARQEQKKWKKCLEILSLCTFMCTIHEDHMIYSSWNIRCDWQKFSTFWAIFCPFSPLITTWKIKILTLKKTTADIIILHICTINDNHVMYGSWDMERDRHNFLSFWTVFLTFYPPMDPENQNFPKNGKNTWRYYHFTNINNSHMIMAPQIWSAMDRIFCHFGLFLALLRS